MADVRYEYLIMYMYRIQDIFPSELLLQGIEPPNDIVKGFGFPVFESWLPQVVMPRQLGILPPAGRASSPAPTSKDI
ncbi:hypothetical protein AMTR_s00003p00269820 [Amborella trichopoda]|uniref:Uncharacterized protein n=1 Tax=Amborella trichopoda TaxID=13333 RepID=W1P0X9_AMBTC|nr:hypothetical protein AMTR_s00003p00269820 [Amborella trichopoda]